MQEIKEIREGMLRYQIGIEATNLLLKEGVYGVL